MHYVQVHQIQRQSLTEGHEEVCGNLVADVLLEVLGGVTTSQIRESLCQISDCVPDT